jgi:tRNA pseudouridine55 synthase
MAAMDPIERLQHAILLIDKPEGSTSFDVVAAVKRMLKTKKAGHSGTLDKSASGLLVICTGRATKMTRYFLEERKRYTGTVQLGVQTDTDDATGSVIAERPLDGITEEAIRLAAARYIGDVHQIPPSFSALKVRGKRASDIMRSGSTVDLRGRDVHIHEMTVADISLGEGRFRIEVECAKGTYIRSLARDIGNDLETGGHLMGLRRVRSGNFDVRDSATLGELDAYIGGGAAEKSFIVAPGDAFRDYSSLVVKNGIRKRVQNGADFSPDDVLNMSHGDKKTFIIFDEDQNMIAIADIDTEKWHIAYLNTFHDAVVMANT